MSALQIGGWKSYWVKTSFPEFLTLTYQQISSEIIKWLEDEQKYAA